MSATVVIKKRLQVQPVGRPGIDRSLVFVTGEVNADERRRLRGVLFEASDKLDALWTFRDLHKMAKEAVAKGEVAQFLDALDRRTGVRKDAAPTFAAFAAEWEKTCVDGSDLRESQILSDKSILKNHLKPFFGRMTLREIDPRQIDRFKAEKRRQKHQYGTGYSPHTINNQLSALHRIFEKAVEYGILDRNPVTKGAWLHADKTPEDFENWWTPADEEKAFRHLREVWKERRPLRYIAILVQLVVGLRFSELRALEKKDLDLNAQGLWVRRSMARKKVSTPKNKKARFHPIPKELAEELQRWMLKTEGQLLFPGTRGGPLPNNSLNRWFTELCQEAGVRRISSHGARHTSGSSYALQGASQKLIATMLGHADTDATARYTHVQATAAAPLIEARWARLAGGGPGQ